MKVLPITNYSPHKQHSPKFGYSGKCVYNKVGTLDYRTTTFFYRSDLNWWILPNFLNKKYKNVPRVHIINHACSSGEESFSLAMRLIDSLKISDAQKFFPIIAKDIDEENIQKAKQGTLIADINECAILEDIMFNDPYRYFNIVTPPTFNTKKSVFARFEAKEIDATNGFKIIFSPSVCSKINFSQGDILEDSKKLPARNTVLLCRNIMPYFSHEQRELLLKNISECFVDESSLLILGKYDFSNDNCSGMSDSSGKEYMENLLEKYNFVKTNIDYIYQKKCS